LVDTISDYSVVMVSGKTLVLGGLLMFVIGATAGVVLNAVDAGPAAGAVTAVGVAALAGMLGGQAVLRASRRDPHA
jgi:hypothetical protein